MIKLTKYEKESIINWNQEEETASIYTFDSDLKHRLADFSVHFPELCKLVRTTDNGSATYEIAKSRLSIRLVPPYSEERRKAASEYAKKHGLNSEKTNE